MASPEAPIDLDVDMSTDSSHKDVDVDMVTDSHISPESSAAHTETGVDATSQSSISPMSSGATNLGGEMTTTQSSVSPQASDDAHSVALAPPRNHQSSRAAPRNKRRHSAKYIRFGQVSEPKMLSRLSQAIAQISKILRSRESENMVRQQFINIESPKIDLLPIILAADVPLVRYGTRARDFPENLLAATYKIDRVTGRRGRGRGLQPAGNSWGLNEQGRQDLKRAGKIYPQPYIIRGQDLRRFCMGLQAADVGYRMFGQCTRHTVTFRDPKDNVDKKRARYRKRILDIFGKTLTGFADFHIQRKGQQALFSTEQLDEVVDQHVPNRSEILEDLLQQRDVGHGLFRLTRYQEAADTFLGGAQQILWLDNRGLLRERRGDGGNISRASLARHYYRFLLLEAEACVYLVHRGLDASWVVVEWESDADSEASQDRAYTDIDGSELQKTLERAQSALQKIHGFVFGDVYVEPDNAQWTKFGDLQGQVDELRFWARTENVVYVQRGNE